jgi:hypothetical protein
VRGLARRRGLDAARLRGRIPGADTLGDAETLLREIECRVHTWLFGDDFHRIAGQSTVE